MHWDTGGSRRGGALVYALGASLLVCGMAASFLKLTNSYTQRQTKALDTKLAFYLAEGALAEAATGVSVGRTGQVGSPGEPAVFGDGLFWVEVTELPDQLVQLDAVAMVDSARTRLSMVVRRGQVDFGTLGFFGSEGVEVRPGSTIDAYDSESGGYGKARLRSNGKVLVQGTAEAPTVVDGTVVHGLGDGVVVSDGANVTGAITESSADLVLAGVEDPGLERKESLIARRGKTVVITDGAAGYEQVLVGAESSLLIAGPAVLSVGDFVVEPLGNLAFDTTSGPIEVYVDRRLVLGPGSTIKTSDASPEDLVVEVDELVEETVLCAASGDFCGILYVPGSRLEIGEDLEIHGAAIADHLVFLGATQLHFDQNLVASARSAAMPEVVSWRIEEMAIMEEVLAGGSPFTVLGLDPDALPRPGDAHQDVPLSVEYVDQGGTQRSYTGMESGFDWSDVAAVDSMQRNGNEVLLPEEPVALSALEVQQIETLQGMTGSKDIESFLMDNAVLSEQVLLAAAALTAVSSGDLEDGFKANDPLPLSVLWASVNDSVLVGGDLVQVLERNHPLQDDLFVQALHSGKLDDNKSTTLLREAPSLSDEVLSGAIDAPQLSPGHLRLILQEREPVRTILLSKAAARIPPVDISGIASRD